MMLMKAFEEVLFNLLKVAKSCGPKQTVNIQIQTLQVGILRPKS